jgi:hypothetical protein
VPYVCIGTSVNPSLAESYKLDRNSAADTYDVKEDDEFSLIIGNQAVTLPPPPFVLVKNLDGSVTSHAYTDWRNPRPVTHYDSAAPMWSNEGGQQVIAGVNWTQGPQGGGNGTGVPTMTFTGQ